MAGRDVAYITDVEGNWDFWVKSVERSPYLSFVGDEVVLSEGAYFVFGGDAGDKGVGTVRFCKQLVALKQKHPDRVFFIIGNRDANKIRLTSELDDSDMATLPPLPVGVTGTPKSCRDYIVDKIVARGGAADAASVTQDQIAADNTKANRLRWILDCTMGAVGDFERRRTELALMGGVDQATISDDDVVTSYLDSVRPGGFMYEYLRLGQLAVQLDQTLFTHGGVMGIFNETKHEVDCVLESCLGFVPGQAERVEDLLMWVDAMNGWVRAQVEEAFAQPTWAPGRTQRGGQALVMYSAYTEDPSLIMAKPVDAKTHPVPTPPSIASRLLAVGITRVVVGHQPHGTCPTLIRGAGVDVLMVDTSYSDMKAPDNRGAAVSCVSIRGPVAWVSGVLPDGVEFKYHHVCPGAPEDIAATADPLVGTGNYHDWFVKTRLASPVDGDKLYLFCQIDVHKFSYKYGTEAEAAALSSERGPCPGVK